MIVLATGNITSRSDEGRVIATIESGADRIEVSLSFHQACKLGNAVLKHAVEALGYKARSGEVIPFPSIKRRSKRGTGA